VSVVVGALVRIVSKGRRRDTPAEPKLPQGAEAALWSITEAVPDPRNHLAMVRDLSGEVRVTDIEQAMLVHAYENRMPDGTDKANPPTAAAERSLLPPPPPPNAISPHRLVLVEHAPVDGTEPAAEEAPDEVIVDVRNTSPRAMDPYYDLGEIAENAPLTDHLFTASSD
jgi:hypothetical protein